MTDFQKYKTQKIEKEKQQMNEITKGLDNLDYAAVLRAKGLMPIQEGVSRRFQEKYDANEAEKFDKLHKKMEIPDFPDELETELQDDWEAILKEGKTSTSMR